MSSKQINSDDPSYYVENLLFNHDIEILAQFIKDMSFEKKEDFAFFIEEDFKGKTDFSLNIEVQNKQRGEDKNIIIVSLIVNLVAKVDNKAAFILDMNYCGFFKFPKVSEDMLKKQIQIECPRMLFPYIRRIVSQTMIESGMPNIDIKNINFFDLYKSNSKN